jgi:hypothetical protein
MVLKINNGARPRKARRIESHCFDFGLEWQRGPFASLLRTCCYKLCNSILGYKLFAEETALNLEVCLRKAGMGIFKDRGCKVHAFKRNWCKKDKRSVFMH